MKSFVWAANILGWPLIHLSISFVFARLPQSYFQRDCGLTAPLAWERTGRIYRHRLQIRKWKRHLPDGAPWVGGFSKKRMPSRNESALALFILETRRAEIAHWCMFACSPIFVLWNPLWACVVMTTYGLAANLPCILTQRYNRIALTNALRRRTPLPEYT